jgi:hypothetical protein
VAWPDLASRRNQLPPKTVQSSRPQRGARATTRIPYSLGIDTDHIDATGLAAEPPVNVMARR